ncbi:MAG: hypothetical protein QCH31_07690 [Methanolobus sp.]|nr:hypothetical protein [Methanolobus sp.]
MRLPIVFFIGLVLLLANTCNIADARSDNVEWLEAKEYTLYWGDEINHSGYLIKAVDFSPAKPKDTDNDYVMLSISSIYHDSWGAILANNTATAIPNNTVFDNRLNITALEIVTGNNIPSPYTTINVAVSNSTEIPPVVLSWMDSAFELKEQSSNEIYIDERAYFNLKLTNLNTIPMPSVTISKELPKDLVFDPDSDSRWELSFPPHGKKTLEFSMKALKPGTYELNGTLITVEHDGRTYSKELNASTLVVHGPYINVSKSLSSDNVELNGEVNITLEITNEGDRAAHVKISDQLPAGAVLLFGENAASRVLHADESISIIYSIRMGKAGEIVVPASRARFVDSKGYEGTVHSGKTLIHVRDPFDTKNEDGFDEDLYSHYSYEDHNDTYTEDLPEPVSDASEKQDHGRLQFLHDILGSITGFLKDTKDKIL